MYPRPFTRCLCSFCGMESSVCVLCASSLVSVLSGRMFVVTTGVAHVGFWGAGPPSLVVNETPRDCILMSRNTLLQDALVNV